MKIVFTNHSRESIKSRIGALCPYAIANTLVHVVLEAWLKPEHKERQQDKKYLIRKNGFNWIVEHLEDTLKVVTVFPAT